MLQAALFNSEPFHTLSPSICPRKAHTFFIFGDLHERPPHPTPPQRLKKKIFKSVLHSAFAHFLSHSAQNTDVGEFPNFYADCVCVSVCVCLCGSRATAVRKSFLD